MKKGAEPGTEMRHNIHKIFTEKAVSYSTRLELLQPMDGLTEEDKEQVAQQLLTIIKDCKTEQEMLYKANVSVKYSDSEYLKAVKSGDTETA